MSLANVEFALRKAFRDGGFFADANSAYDNAAFEPSAGTPWARITVIPTQPEVTSLGDTGYDEAVGVLQVDLFYPLNQGNGQALTKAEAIRSYFKAGKRFSYGGQDVVSRSAGYRNGREQNGWFRVMVEIQYIAHINRS